MSVNSQLHSLKRWCFEYLYYQNLMVSNSLKSVFVWQNDSTINFSVLLKVCSMLHYESAERVHNKNAAFCFHILFCHFLVVFHHKICIFIISISFIMKYQISATEYWRIRNKNWWSKIVNRTVHKLKGL